MVKIPRIPQINGKVGLRAAEDRRRQAAGPRPQKKTKKGHKKWAGQKQRCLKRKKPLQDKWKGQQTGVCIMTRNTRKWVDQKTRVSEMQKKERKELC